MSRTRPANEQWFFQQARPDWAGKRQIFQYIGPEKKRQKSTFLMCQLLNGLTFKSLKPKRSRPNSKKNWSGKARAKILYYVTGSGQKCHFSFRLSQNFYLQFELSPGLKCLACADLYWIVTRSKKKKRNHLCVPEQC